ncbi:hypothetical protein KUCAC02_021786, partial [Chaenocephalus aceratus]
RNLPVAHTGKEWLLRCEQAVAMLGSNHRAGHTNISSLSHSPPLPPHPRVSLSKTIVPIPAQTLPTLFPTLTHLQALWTKQLLD